MRYKMNIPPSHMQSLENTEFYLITQLKERKKTTQGTWMWKERGTLFQAAFVVGRQREMMRTNMKSRSNKDRIKEKERNSGPKNRRWKHYIHSEIWICNIQFLHSWFTNCACLFFLLTSFPQILLLILFSSSLFSFKLYPHHCFYVSPLWVASVFFTSLHCSRGIIALLQENKRPNMGLKWPDPNQIKHFANRVAIVILPFYSFFKSSCLFAFFFHFFSCLHLLAALPLILL